MNDSKEKLRKLTFLEQIFKLNCSRNFLPDMDQQNIWQLKFRWGIGQFRRKISSIRPRN